MSLPTAKPTSSFLSRKPHIATIQEALNKFAAQLSAPGVADSVKAMLDGSRVGENPMLQISLRISRDFARTGQFVASLSTKTSCESGKETFVGLTE